MFMEHRSYVHDAGNLYCRCRELKRREFRGLRPKKKDKRKDNEI